MARKLIVEFVGDSSQLERSFSKASKSANKFGNDISKVGRGSIAAAISFRGLGRSIAFASAGFLGGFGLVSAIRAAFEEQGQFQKANAQTAAVLKSTGEVAGVTAENVDKLATAISNVTGLDDELVKAGENILLTFTNIRNVAGKNNDVFTQAIKLSTDLATAMHLDLQQAALQVGKALNDPARGYARLQRIGVAFTKQQVEQIKALEKSGNVLGAQKIILRELQREFGGSARAAGDTLPGKLNKLRETLTNLGGAIAGLITPAIEKTVDRLVKWTQKTENQQRVLRDAKQVIHDIGEVINTLSGALRRLNDITGSTENTFKLLLGTFLAFKGIQLVGGIAGLATALGGASAGATTFSAALAGNAGLIALTGAAAFALTTMALNATGLDKALGRAGGAVFDFAAKLGLVKDPLKEFQGKIIPDPGDIKRFRDAIRQLMQTRNITKENAIDVFVRLHPEVSRHDVEVAAGLLAQVQPPAGILGPITAKDVKQRRGAKPPTIGTDVESDKNLQKRLRAAREAARQAAVDAAGLAVDRAQLTESLDDDLTALLKLNALLKRRIAGGHDTIELERQQLGVLQQIADIRKQQAEAAKKARDARQFKLLGFGPSGEDLVPGVKSLKRQLGSIADAISGSFLDTRKTRGLLGHIRQVLAGGLGSVSSEVRSKIQQILADLKAQLKQSSVDVTRFQKTARGQFTLAGAHPAGGGVTIHGGIHLHGVQNVKDLENELAKRNKQRAHGRRGTR